MSERFEGMTAVITGGASGIGLTVARRMVAEGGGVMLWDIDPARLDAATAKLGEKSRAGGSTSPTPTEVERAAEGAAPRWAGSTRSSAAPESRARPQTSSTIRSASGSGCSTSTSTASSIAIASSHAR